MKALFKTREESNAEQIYGRGDAVRIYPGDVYRLLGKKSAARTDQETNGAGAAKEA